MKFGSVCSGMEAASLAWSPLGWQCAFTAEIDKAPCELLEQRFPSIPNFGDVNNFKDWPDVAIDLLVGGTPCQSFSVAGLRKGLSDPRGSLMLTYGAIAKRYRPAWLVWENVPGVLSDDEGRSFGTFLGMLAELGYGFAYRVLDAQYFDLAQRRARVFVVAHLGDWRPPAAVLFEPESLRGDSPPRREAGERPAPTISARTQGGGGLGTDFDCDGGLISHSLRADGFDASEDGTGRGTPLVPIAFALRGRDDGAVPEIEGEGDKVGALRAADGGSSRDYIAFSCKDHGADAGDTAPTLRAMGHNESHANAGGQLAVAFDLGQCTAPTHRRQPGPVAGALNGNAREAIAFNGRMDPVPGAVPGAIDTDPQSQCVVDQWAVRRLTPRECERLQGAPDDWTNITRKGKPIADGPRYKMLGNSMAIPVMQWIGERIDLVRARMSPVSETFLAIDGAGYEVRRKR